MAQETTTTTTVSIPSMAYPQRSNEEFMEFHKDTKWETMTDDEVVHYNTETYFMGREHKVMGGYWRCDNEGAKHIWDRLWNEFPALRMTLNYNPFSSRFMITLPPEHMEEIIGKFMKGKARACYWEFIDGKRRYIKDGYDNRNFFAENKEIYLVTKLLNYDIYLVCWEDYQKRYTKEGDVYNFIN